MSSRRLLTDILRDTQKSTLADAWGDTEAAGDFEPLPPGEYIAHIESGELFTARQKGTPGYKLSYRVAEGEYAGRHVWDDIWLTQAALPLAKRDLAKLGITTLEQLEQPFPPGIHCRIKVVTRKADNGNESNQVRSFEVVGIDAPEDCDFAPPAPPTPEENEGGTA